MEIDGDDVFRLVPVKGGGDQVQQISNLGWTFGRGIYGLWLRVRDGVPRARYRARLTRSMPWISVAE